MHLLHTERLTIRPFSAADADFILVLLNDPGWLRFIGDKNVHSREDAQRYLREGPLAMYARHGLGLCCVERRADGAAIGMCGLIRRDNLPDVDIGFAFLPAGRGQGLAREAGAAVLAHGFGTLGLARVVAITDEANAASARVLEALGMHFERLIPFGTEGETLRLFAAHAPG
jgi:[ribosomal protein S5]-alanine N-acetyltransferase